MPDSPNNIVAGEDQLGGDLGQLYVDCTCPEAHLLGLNLGLHKFAHADEALHVAEGVFAPAVVPVAVARPSRFAHGLRASANPSLT